MQKLFLLFILTSFLSCNKEIITAYRLSENDLIPEGITYSPKTDHFYISSIYKTKIVKVDAKTGKFDDFVPTGVHNMSYLGMITDDRENHLWACGNLTENGKTTSTVSKFDLHTGKVVKIYSLNDTASLYNDLVQDSQGNIYFTDSHTGKIGIINHATDSIHILYQGKPDEMPYANGITISPDNKYLYVASGLGIHILDIKKKEPVWVSDTMSAGIDGLKFYNNSLIGIKNGVYKLEDISIIKFHLDDSGTKIIGSELIDKGNSEFDIPTTFTIKDNKLFVIANSQLQNINFPKLEIKDTTKLQEIKILQYQL